VTLADVAARAGVSLNTVSRALRAPHTVRPPLRRRIEEVLDELNYVPNRLAGGLAGSHTGVVGVILTSLFFSEFAAVVDTLQAELADAGFSVMLGNSRYDPEEELRLVRAMLSWRPAAMALVGIDRHPRAADLLRSSGIPVIEVWDTAGAAVDSVVGMDHAAIGAMQTRHVLAQGYRRPAFIGCVREHDYRAHKRLAGYTEAVHKAGLESISLTEPTGGHPDLGEGLALRALQRHPEIDALVCNSDIIAMGAMRGLRGRVPGAVGVIGFGDNEAGACMTPSLTSVRPPRAEIGRRTAAVIAARIAGEPPSHHLFEAELALRQSTARPSRHQGE
jgi:LacI family gluconate utilization system Gnt-I transcriptional repressor